MAPVVHPHLSRDPVRVFVETLVVEAGFSGLSPEMRAETVAALMVEAQKRVGLALIKKLDTSSLGDFSRLVDRQAPEDEMSAFFHVRFPDYEGIVGRALGDFGAECMLAAKELSTAS